MFLVTPYPILTVNRQVLTPQFEKCMVTRGSELLGMRAWITSLGKPTRAGDVLFEVEGNLEGMAKKGDEYQLCSQDQLQW